MKKRIITISKKVELYKSLLEKDPQNLSDKEVELLNKLSNDKDIQQILERNK
jgi:hypothetical protein